MNTLPCAEKVKVWDILVRSFHWSLVTLFVLCYLSGDDLEILHVYLGYGIAILLAVRIVWGVIGTRYARFSNFIYGWKTLKHYAAGLFSGGSRHYLGHNPIGGWMILALLVGLLLTCWSGLELYGSQGQGPLARNGLSFITAASAADGEHDREGSGIWKEVHEILANLVLLLVLGHIAGVFGSSLLQGENLVRSMWTGYKINRADKDRSP